jgi:hypothetical protein
VPPLPDTGADAGGQIPKSRIRLEQRTIQRDRDAYNLELSQQRAGPPLFIGEQGVNKRITALESYDETAGRVLKPAPDEYNRTAAG